MSNIDKVGSVVWWSASSIQVDPDVLRAAMPEKHRDLVRRPVEPRVALRRAMRRRQGAEMQEGWRWEEVSADDDGLRIALAKSHRDAAAKEFTASTIFTLMLDNAGTVTFSRFPQTTEEQDAYRTLNARYQIERGSLTADDLRDVIVKVLLNRLKGTRQKEGGAVYFVPAPHNEELGDLAQAVSLAGIRLICLPVREGVAQLEAGVRASLYDEAVALRDEVGTRLKGVVEDGKKARFEALALKLTEAEDLRAKARLYEGLLSSNMAEVRAALSEAEVLVRETMKIMAERAAA